MIDAVLLAFNLDATALEKLGRICDSLNMRLRSVTEDLYAVPMGALLGLPVSGSEQAGQSASFEDPMLVMCNLDEQRFNAFLQALRWSGIPRIDLKAVLTPTNITWTAAQLHDELCREHAEMQRIRKQN